MTDVRELLVPLDGTAEAEAGLRVAAAISKLAGLPVSAMVVCSPHADEGNERSWLADRASRVGIELQRRVVVPGLDVPPLVVEAAGQPGSVVCLATHGRSGAAELVLGSDSNEIVRMTEGPVLLVGPEIAPVEQFTRIMVCLDGSPIASGALDVAAGMASSLGMSLHLVQVVEPDTDTDTDPGGRLRTAAERLEATGLTVDWTILRDTHPARAIVVHADEIGANLLVMGTHGRSGLRAITMGNVANAVVRHAHQPVLVFHPMAADLDAPAI